MKKEQARRWLTEYLQTQQKITTWSVIGLAALGGVTWLVELALVMLIFRVGFVGSFVLALLPAAGILAAVQYFTLRRVQRNLGDVRAVKSVSEDSRSEYRTAQPLSAVWMYAFGSLETDQSWQERLLAILCLPQRMISAAWFTKLRLQELQTLKTEHCAAIIRHLLKEAERVEIDTLAEKLNLPDPVSAIRDVSLIDGVVLLTRKTPGLSLATRLVDEINDWLKQDSQNGAE